ncbi:MAG: HD domain-containing protein [Candidatus Gastranaerophilales bacterium]|nr:HD domain-containing protein [Candidatus Gastranaerophilales bacterium]
MAQPEQFVIKDKIKSCQYILSQVAKERIRHTILIVDDEEDNLQLLNRTLRREYTIITASDGIEALEILKKEGNNISLILSDQRMPNMSGTEFLSRTVNEYPNIIRMLLTGYSDIDAMIEGVNKCGLFQYLTKPYDPEDLKFVIKNGINAYELTVSKKALLHDLKELFFTTIKSISSALDAKDAYTHGHSLRVTLFSLILCKEMGLEENFIGEIEIAGLLHDIGKIGVPENILCKPGKLTDEEFNIIKLHPEKGRKILNGIKRLSKAAFWLNSHHERWDGFGYPQKLKEEDIPLAARILAVADTYDAMTSDRSYRKGLPHETALEEIKRCSGSQFDPSIVETFLKVENTFLEATKNSEDYYSKYSVFNKILSDKELL